MTFENTVSGYPDSRVPGDPGRYLIVLFLCIIVPRHVGGQEYCWLFGGWLFARRSGDSGIRLSGALKREFSLLLD